ncbi:mannose-6-phosphate isomerase [Clavulina sp. PMI_390]|nr:mannose-6-phosphate isomerase [Clavulina sp. PMI_390]
MSVFQLRAVPKTYDWGVIGSNSKVAQYAKATAPASINEHTPYAELWMGTHPSGPSEVVDQHVLLKDHLNAHPQLIGSTVRQHFGDDLPFLFKILAISKALSIQAHPDKALAQTLHAQRPDIYKDNNHKPEMAIAISEFEAFCGFLPPSTISQYLTTVPELAVLIPAEVIEKFVAASTPKTPEPSTGPDPVKEALKALFSALMRASEDQVKEIISKLHERYTGGAILPQERTLVPIFTKLNEQFPGDVGVLCIYILNIVKLSPGQAIFLKANEPHAYISGDIVETMATSDNVVRAGLTPKLRDVDTLVSMLTYTYNPAADQILAPKPFQTAKHTVLYDPPIEEFSVLLTRLGPGQSETHAAIDGPSILIITEGAGSMESAGTTFELRTGQVYFIGAYAEIIFHALANQDSFTIFRAFTVVQ